MCVKYAVLSPRFEFHNTALDLPESGHRLKSSDCHFLNVLLHFEMIIECWSVRRKDHASREQEQLFEYVVNAQQVIYTLPPYAVSRNPPGTANC